MEENERCKKRRSHEIWKRCERKRERFREETSVYRREEGKRYSDFTGKLRENKRWKREKAREIWEEVK